MLRMLERAIGLTLTGQESRKYRLAAIGIRNDGAIVTATNGGVKGARCPSAHAESRVSRKLDVSSVVYVARTLHSGAVSLGRPCKSCQLIMKHRGVSKCYYTIGPEEFGCIIF